MFEFTALYFAADQLNQTIDKSKGAFQEIANTFFSASSILAFVVALLVAIVAGRFIAYLLRRVTDVISAGIDKTDNLAIVTKLRRTETLIVLSIALIRLLLVVFAIYFWWLFIHRNANGGSIGSSQQAGLLGAGALLTLVLTGALSPVLRDLAYGAVMMAEHWYGVGDHISVDPLNDAQGVVERVTLRSTRIRGVNGEIIWVNNQNIWAVRVTPRGVRTLAVELFVNDLEKGIKLIEDTNVRLPIGALVVVSPLSVMTQAQVGDKLWHITAISEIAPGREWLLDKFAINVLKELDASQNVLVHDPISRYADSVAERRFARTIQNSRKRRIERESMVGKVAKQRVKRATKALKERRQNPNDLDD